MRLRNPFGQPAPSTVRSHARRGVSGTVRFVLASPKGYVPGKLLNNRATTPTAGLGLAP